MFSVLSQIYMWRNSNMVQYVEVWIQNVLYGFICSHVVYVMQYGFICWYTVFIQLYNSISGHRDHVVQNNSVWQHMVSLCRILSHVSTYGWNWATFNIWWHIVYIVKYCSSGRQIVSYDIILFYLLTYSLCYPIWLHMLIYELLI